MKQLTRFTLALLRLLAFVLAVLILSAPPPVLARAPALDVVETDAGPVAAAKDSTAEIHIFQGIPYAAPPVGELRWKPPQPVTPWQAVRRADSFAPTCWKDPASAPRALASLQNGGKEGGASEDCLYLNVWTAAQSESERRPVMVYLDAGYLYLGSPAENVNDGTNLARQGVVLVSLNFRSGALGFLAHPDLTHESGQQVSGNYGLRDLIAALQWVKRNIAAFGGEPNNVTIMQKGPGARLVSLLTASPLARGLFQRAIAAPVSAFRSNPTVPDPRLATAEQAGAEWAKQHFGASTLSELRAKPAADLAQVPLPYEDWIVDGYVIPDALEAVYAQGRQNDVPLLAGWEEDAGAYGAPWFTNMASYTDFGQRTAGKAKLAEPFVTAYPAKTDSEASAASYAAARDAVGYSVWAWARAHNATGQTKSYLYYWAYDLPFRSG